MNLLHYDCFASHITAFSTERGDGCKATLLYDGFNINPYCGDSKQHIDACRAALCEHIGVDDTHIILPFQTHETSVANIDAGDSLEGVDAVMTSRRNTLIGVSTADCIPVLLHDVRHDTICAVHSGWRGTVAHITSKALQAMQQAYGTQPNDVVAAIGPGIRLEAFEVGEEVYDAFQAAGFDMTHIAKRMSGRWHIDLVAAVKTDLADVPIVHDCQICTFTNHSRFFSARRLGIKSGRIYTGIVMR